MTDGERQCSAAAAFISRTFVHPSQFNIWVQESRPWLKIKKRRRSVENLLMTGQDVIGGSIGSSLSFNAMTLPNTVPSQGSNQGQQNQNAGESSTNPSPQPSPRLSPRQPNRKDKQKSDSSINTKELSPVSDRLEGPNIEPVNCKENSSGRSERKSVDHASQAVPSSTMCVKTGKQSKGGSSSGSQSMSRSCSSTSDASFYIPEDNISRGSDSSQADQRRSFSVESGKEKKESRGSDRSKKRSTWYSFLLYPTYKSRSKEFNKIFKDLPPEERLIVDYACAVSKEILIQGRLYVSQNYLCFAAKIFGWETLITLPWKNVTAITKEKTALVIPNAILICTEKEKFFFTSFGTRDKTYLMLFRIWQNALLDRQLPLQEMWQWVHACYGQELGLTSEDEDYVDPLLVEGSSRLSMESFSEDCLVTPEETVRIDNVKSSNAILSTFEPGNVSVIGQVSTPQTTAVTSPVTSSSSAALPNSLDTNNAEAQLETDLSDTTESEADKVSDMIGISGGSGQCTSQHDGRPLLQVVLPISVDQLFTLVFTNSKFFVDFHVSRNSSDIKLSPWTQNANSDRLRTLSLTININQPVVGRRKSQITETQIMSKSSKPGKMYAIDCETINGGIPYADSFTILNHYCLNKVSETESSLAVFCEVKYKKSVWGVIKSFIEKHTWVGLEEFFSSLEKALQAECCVDEENVEEEIEVPPKVRRRLRGSSRRLSSTHHTEEVLAPRSQSSTGRRSLPRGSVGTAGNTFENAGPRQVDIAATDSVDIFNIVILGILLLLVLLNGVLYYKLICLERWALFSPIPIALNEDLQSISKNPPTTQEDWIHLLRQQESLHTVEMQKWQKVLQSSVMLLREIEDSLKELQMSIQPRVKHKLASAIKVLTDNMDGSE